MKSNSFSSRRRLFVNLLVLSLMLVAFAITPANADDEFGIEFSGCTKDINKPHSTSREDGLDCYPIENGYYACLCQSCCQRYYTK